VKPRDDGESLIELIIAMAILGTTMLTIVGGFLSLSKISGIARDQGKSFAALTAASEYAKNRPCVATASCTAESSVPSSSVPHDADTAISISAPSSIVLATGSSALTQFVVTVTTGSATFTNTVVVR
jgi:hypothetical protein